MLEIDEIEYMEPKRFPPAMTEAEQWLALKACLEDDGLLKERFTERLIAKMKRRKQVNIAKVAASVAEHLGDQCGSLAAAAMRDAAKMTTIIVKG